MDRKMLSGGRVCSGYVLGIVTAAVVAGAGWATASQPNEMTTIGPVVAVTHPSQDTFLIRCDSARDGGGDQVKIQFWDNATVRVWLAIGGNFTDKASGDLVVGSPNGVMAEMTKTATGYNFAVPGQSSVMVIVTSNPAFSYQVISPVSHDPIVAESAPLSWNKTHTCSAVAASPDEYFFGGGMQNGRWSHRNHTIRISTDFNWADGGNPNAVPFYLSTAGYGVYRNTWSKGEYDFAETNPATVATCHSESRFDAFYFAGNFKEVLKLYTAVTGPPFLIPIYGLGLGDSDCYHNGRHGNSTQVVVALADEYRRRDMPGAWFLPNDGYGCGFGEDPVSFPKDFTDLDTVVAELHKRGFYTGLWSSTGLPNITREVKGSGVRIGKTDVGWIGGGYQYAFDSVRLVSDGIENNSDGRRFIWTVEGWAGTHRMAVMWTGDDSGSFEYIKWQIPTFIGTGFSAQAHVSGDVDGIFGGSPDTYVRDLQFKCFMTAMMTMSGWAANPDKQPWTYGEPYTSINRMYLKLKSRLLPYLYTISRDAYDTGYPPVRAMALEFPDDPATLVNGTGTAFQFMSGPSFLVAPVFENATTRDGIYLPAGTWYDYWSGKRYDGPSTIDGYPAPLNVLPVFVRSGSIVPMWPEMLYFDEAPADPITVDIWPNGTTSFTMYEDDGVTRAAIEGDAYARTTITVSSSETSALAPINVTIGAAVGKFPGLPEKRSWVLQLHYNKKRLPQEVMLAGGVAGKLELKQYQSYSALEHAGVGYFAQHDQPGFGSGVMRATVFVMTGPQPTNSKFEVSLSQGKSFPPVCLIACDTTTHHQVEPQAFVTKFPSSDPVPIVLKATGECLTYSTQMDPASGTPAVEFEQCKLDPKTGKPAANQGWTYDPTDLNIRSGQNKHQCMDQDATDHKVEIYGCGNKQINQQWNINPDGSGHIVTAGNGKLCMSKCPASASFLAEEAKAAAVLAAQQAAREQAQHERAMRMRRRREL